MNSYISILGLIISAIAISLTLYTVIQSRNARRADSYFRAQEFLMRPDVQDGRQILYAANSTGTLPDGDTELMAKVYRSLATLNAAASLAYRGAVPLSWLLDFWHHHLREIESGYKLAVKSREAWRPMPWSYLKRFIDDARTYQCPECPVLGAQPDRGSGAALTSGLWQAIHDPNNQMILTRHIEPYGIRGAAADMRDTETPQAAHRGQARTGQRRPSCSLVISTGASPGADLQTDHAAPAQPARQRATPANGARRAMD